jgi:hypothetical protein
MSALLSHAVAPIARPGCLAEIRRPGCATVLWRCPSPLGMLPRLARFLPARLPTARGLRRPENARATLQAVCDAAGAGKTRPLLVLDPFPDQAEAA